MLFHQTLPKPNVSNAPPAFYRLHDVMRICALSRSTIYRCIAEGRFPHQFDSGEEHQPGPARHCRLG